MLPSIHTESFYIPPIPFSHPRHTLACASWPGATERLYVRGERVVLRIFTGTSTIRVSQHRHYCLVYKMNPWAKQGKGRAGVGEVNRMQMMAYTVVDAGRGAKQVLGQGMITSRHKR